MVQMASSQQLALHSLLLFARSEAAARRGQSRDRHFARVFAIPVVNAADADCVCLWHRMALCSAHGYAGSIASPGGGPLPFWACSTARARMAAAAAAVAGAWALLWRWLAVASLTHIDSLTAGCTLDCLGLLLLWAACGLLRSKSAECLLRWPGLLGQQSRL